MTLSPCRLGNGRTQLRASNLEGALHILDSHTQFSNDEEVSKLLEGAPSLGGPSNTGRNRDFSIFFTSYVARHYMNLENNRNSGCLLNPYSSIAVTILCNSFLLSNCVSA